MQEMKTPSIGQRVFSALGLPGVFKVVKLDETHRVADIELVTDPMIVQTNIAFDDLLASRQGL